MRCNYSDKEVLQLELYPSNHTGAPWENMSRITKNIPDILMIPQSYLGECYENKNNFFCLDKIRKDRNFKKTNHLSIFNFDYLDTIYPNWRRLVIHESSILGLPFSINSTLLCVNNKLYNKMIKEHISQIYDKKFDSNDSFLPTGWTTIFNLFESANNKENIFEMSLQGRALYYAWISFVLHYGNIDLEVVEGNYVLESRIKTCREGTARFLDLINKIKPDKYYDFDVLHDRFMNEKVACYISWTDSFFLDRNDSNSFIFRPIHLPNRENVSDLDIRILRIPRNMMFPRRPLVAGWIMTFPKKNSDDNLDITNKLFPIADFILSKNSQKELIRCGFPTSSRPVLEEEIRLIQDELFNSKG